MIYFLDTSALIKRYVSERGSPSVRRLFAQKRSIALSRITHAEVAATIARLFREGRLKLAERDAILAAFSHDARGAEVTVEARPALMISVAGLVQRQPLRAYDAVQLASAIQLSSYLAIDFWSADARLVEAARAEKLRATLVG